jgi:hypothetical protein
MMSNVFQKIGSYPSAWVLILSNLFPVFGLIFLDFDILSVILIYWAESGIVGFYGILKMVFIKQPTSLISSHYTKLKVVGVPVKTQSSILAVSKLFMIPFFMVHFGGFMMGHLIFILVFFAPETSGFFWPFSMLGVAFSYFKTIWIGVLLLFVSHGYSFYVNYLRSGEYNRLGIQTAMFQPYKRIIIMHVTLIFGGFLFIFSGQLIAILVLFVFLKIIVDLGSHLREREKFGIVLR